MNNRIKLIRQNENMTQSQFAEKIGLSRNYVAMIEIGQRDPSDRTVSDICRIFGVNPAWLRNGEEPMMMPEADSETAYINELLKDVDNPFVGLIKSIMSVYVDLSPDDKKKAAAFAASLSDKIKESRD